MKTFSFFFILAVLSAPCLAQETVRSDDRIDDAATGAQLAQQQSQNKSGSFSAQEYWKLKREYMIEKARLTDDEVKAFFPLYTEMWQKKQELNRKVREQKALAEKHSCSEEECRKALDLITQTNIRIAHLEKEYSEKFKAILPATKLLKLKYADEEFNSDILKDIQKSRANRFQEQQQSKPGSPVQPAA